MLFNSYFFIFIFLPVAWLGYFALNKYKMVDLAKSWLLGCSLFFYGYYNPSYLPLILVSILVNHAITTQLQNDKNERHKTSLFYFSLCFNLGLLGYFKYMNFFLDNFSALTTIHLEPLKIILPLGISFYTLQQVAYLIDVYQGVAGEKRFIDYALFVTFFPYLLSGPIGHYSEIMPQFESLRAKVFNYRNVALGLFVFTIGLSKKVLIADTLSGWVSDGYLHPEKLHFFHAWGTSLSYTFQLYFDFSGYSDMAIGLGLLFNIKIPQNFNSPFRAGNINDFWARWHMTLSLFIRTYIFTPLVKCMPKTTFGYSMIAMFLAMTIAGIWHGAAWTFVIYGMLHGLAIVIHYYWKKRKKKVNYFLAWLVTFNFVNFTFIIFRSRTLTEAKHVVMGMLGLQGFQFPKMGISFINKLGAKMGPYMSNDQNLQLIIIIVSFILIFKAQNTSELQESFKPRKRLAVLTACMFVICLFGLNRVSEFIYFNF
ncbi:MAG TPA: MBOAT family O-acyltransferase [Bacteriovoracaceae bacterium]|nr:MBOAT family O-acyltransferase [Bacteriovoracaceae bacterium]